MNLYPKTTADNVTIKDGRTVQEFIDQQKKIVCLAKYAKTPTTVSSDASVAHVDYTVGTDYAGYCAMVTSINATNTPYNQIYNISARQVDSNGVLPVDFKGAGFVKGHTFAVNILLFK